jgi:predicted oxidoreductase (fatty acid repression mutant protein)
MSTPQKPRNADPQVLHPLDRLRGTIRRYVVIEGALAAALFLSVWFALALLFDFVLFKATGWDWVQDGSRSVRGVALLVALALFAAVLYFRIARRLATEFSYPALALVLERKFPKLLGDRLITAVELADVKGMAKFGYSADMINATIAEARERVAQVPVNEVFNWKRLWVIGALAVLVPLFTVVAGFVSHAVATKSADPGRFAWKFVHTAGVLAERDLMLQNTPWPRRAHIELVGFPEDPRIVTASDDGTAKVWDAKTGAEVLALQGHKGAVTAAAFNSDGTRIVTASDDQSVRLWDAKTGREVLAINGHAHRVRAVAFSADGTRIVTASDDRTVRVWDANTGKEVRAVPLRGHAGGVTAASFGGNGARLVTVSDDQKLRVWDTNTGAVELDILGGIGRVTAAAFSADGTRIVTASDNKTARVWDANTGAELLSIAIGSPRDQSGAAQAASFSPDGTRIVTASGSAVLVWDAKTGAKVFGLNGHAGAVNAAAFSASLGELTVGRDSPEPPKIRARAFRWVKADRAAPGGWRPLMWDDVGELLGRAVPPLSGRYVDDLERLLGETDGVGTELARDRDQLMQELGTGNFGVAQEAFKALAAKADAPSSGRAVRKLDVPESVTYKFTGRTTSGSGELALQEGTFVGVVSDRNGKTPQEAVAFEVRGEDFATPPKRIRPIPPPSLKRLYREQAEPAYLHHAPPAGETYAHLKGKFQKMAPVNLPLTGERTVFAVPAGSELTVVGEAFTADDGTVHENDAIVSAEAIPVAGRFPGMKFDEQGRPTQARVPLTVAANGSLWGVWFGGAFRVTEKVEFKVEWKNKYNVSTTRSFVVQATEDAPPAVEVAVDVIRKVGNSYMVTPKARIPFDPASFVKDDRGLQNLLFTFEYAAEDSEVVKALRAKLLVRAFEVPVPGAVVTPVASVKHIDTVRAVDGADAKRKGEASMTYFRELQSALVRETADAFARALDAPKVEAPAADTTKRAVKNLTLDSAARDYFDLKQLHDAGLLDIAAKSNEDVQTVYRFDLYLTATDTNVDRDGGASVARNAEPIRLRIVSESDLLVEIGNEEVALGMKLDDALVKLVAAKQKYAFVRSSNGFREEVPEQVDSVKVRGQDAFQDVEKARDLVQGVAREYRRLVRECEINRLNEAVMKRLTDTAVLIESVVTESPNPKDATFPKTQTLMLAVQNVLNVGRWAPLVAVSDAENALFALESHLREIRARSGEAVTKENIIKGLRALLDKQKRVRDEVIAFQRDLEGVLSSPVPTIGAVGALALNKGEARKVSQTIQWNKYPKDDVVVTVTASDPSIVVPAELKLDFEKNQFRFEYEVKAGAKEGTYKITVTPAVGKPVEYPVVVK